MQHDFSLMSIEWFSIGSHLTYDSEGIAFAFDLYVPAVCYDVLRSKNDSK